ncbi:MAG: NAD-dependent epimerase/dehydratase family protein [Saprospiraceae bacterium]|nr:NAD-dependent epimerase/dehydratase family protein [Saprospiraceae bacterium]
MRNPLTLITGANGQIGKELTKALRNLHGTESVICTDLKPDPDPSGPFELLDITDINKMKQLIGDYKVTQIYHLAALLSSKGEQNPQLTWSINFDAYLKILNLAVEMEIDRLFFPSTIGIYGPTTPKVNTPQNASFLPSTVYGISKLTGEMWGQYFRNRYKLDVRSIRYPGVISYGTIPSGGTTDFAVEMFFEALAKGKYISYLLPDTRLPMVYMPDVINGTLQLMNAPIEKVSIASAYNLAAFSLTPASLAESIKVHIPEFEINYQPDHRQAIAESWTETIDDSLARSDWGWAPEYDMTSMVQDMLSNIRIQQNQVS